MLIFCINILLYILFKLTLPTHNFSLYFIIDTYPFFTCSVNSNWIVKFKYCSYAMRISFLPFWPSPQYIKVVHFTYHTSYFVTKWKVHIRAARRGACDDIVKAARGRTARAHLFCTHERYTLRYFLFTEYYFFITFIRRYYFDLK